jgi:hypothetical protein
MGTYKEYIKRRRGREEEDFVQVRTLFKDYTHIIKAKLEINSIITKFIIIAHN